ncbi:hypothetical protein D9619_007594 [Psilocybe cf. subviscida]|uniref:Uncharacterized protein n=1 Tax=Psilocybe cf. subviscida TaxID=2480587 RepID=A0A8H5B2I9_9AGAR|nr:hypothetical protein D9619_007594 [Psilocybe cf. subviscida]
MVPSLARIDGVLPLHSKGRRDVPPGYQWRNCAPFCLSPRTGHGASMPFADREKLSIVDRLFAGAAPIVARLAGLPRFDPFTLFIVCTAAHPRPPLLLAILLVSTSASAIDISSTPPLSGAILFMSLRYGVDTPLISMSQLRSRLRVFFSVLMQTKETRDVVETIHPSGYPSLPSVFGLLRIVHSSIVVHAVA